MSFKRFLLRGGVFRLFGFFTAVTLCAMIGCGNLSGGCFGLGGVASDNDNDGLVNDLDNCPDEANADQADTDEDGVGDLCDNCPATANTDQADVIPEGGNGIGDACDGDSGPPVTVNAGPDQIACPGDTVTLDATSNPLQPNATITWTQTAGPPVYIYDTLAPVINAPDPVIFAAPSTAAIGVQLNLTFLATGTAIGGSNGTDTVQITTRPVDTADVETKSSGAAQPGDSVTIELDDTESPDLIPVWVQDASDAIRVSLVQPSDSQAATFIAPQVSVTTDLHFVAVVPLADCSTGEGLIRSGALTVPIQVATVELDLPATIRTGQQYNLYNFTLVNGDPTSPTALESVDLTLLFFAVAPGGGELPSGVNVSINQTTGVLTVTAGAGKTIEIIARLFGTAGELANNEGDGDTVPIVN